MRPQTPTRCRAASRHARTTSPAALFLVSLLALAPGTPPAARADTGRILHVATSGNDTGDGLAWASALRTLQTALATAAPGDEIWIATGVYRPNDLSGSLSQSQWFQLKNGVALYGGFAGTETQRAQRDPDVHPTVLSGDLADDDRDLDSDGFSDPDSIGDNCLHVFYHPSTLALDPSARIDGVTIRGGNASDASPPHNLGGAIYNQSSSPTITGCILTRNAAGKGGAMVNDASSPAIADCAFTANTVGAALTNNGGAMVNENGAAPAIERCTFSGNLAGFGGALYNSASSPSISLSTFTSNRASYGGAVYSYSSCSPAIHDSTFTANSATNGGAINSDGASPDIRGCTFTGNAATYGGAIFNFNPCQPSITNSTVHSNGATAYGAGILNYGGASPPIVNCTLTENVATTEGGAVANLSGAAPLIVNSLAWANSPATQIYDQSSTPTVSHCLVQGGYAGGTNIQTNPPLLQPLGDHGGSTQTRTIAWGSPAIGNGTSSPIVPPDDQRGVPRDLAPDIGACEFLAALATADDPTLPAPIGGTKSCTVFTDHFTPTYQWYIGASGDISQPITGALDPTLALPLADLGLNLWVRVSPGDSAPPADSPTLEIAVRGTFDQWCDFHSLAGADRDPAAIPARDGIVNLLKFALGLPPNTPSTLSARCTATSDPAAHTLTQRCALSRTPTDLSADIVASDALLSWSTDPVTLSAISQDAAFRVEQGSISTAGSAPGFLSLRVAPVTP